MHFQGILKVIDRLEIPFVEELNGWVRTSCPFAPFRHEKGTDNKPGFGISIKDDEPSWYNCLSCKSKGPLSTLPMQLAHYRDDISLIEFGQKLQQDELLGGSFEFGEWEVEADPDEETETHHRVTNFPSEAEFFATFPSPLSDPEACKYLARRGLSVSTIVLLGLRYDPWQHRVLFPIYDQRTGRYAGCSGRTVKSGKWIARHELDRQRTHPKFTYPKIRDYGGLQKDRLLLAPRQLRIGGGAEAATSNYRGRLLQCAASYSSVTVVEGLFAYGHLRRLDPRRLVVALLGSALTPGKAQLLLDLNLPVYWLTDNDVAGKACLYGTYDKETQEFAHDKSGALYRLYGELAQFTLDWPEGKIDPDQLTLGEYRQMIEDAELWIK